MFDSGVLGADDGEVETCMHLIHVYITNHELLKRTKNIYAYSLTMYTLSLIKGQRKKKCPENTILTHATVMEFQYPFKMIKSPKIHEKIK